MIPSLRRATTAMLVAALVMAACSSDDDGIVDETVLDTTTTTLSPRVVGDGRLVIGALLPVSDALIGEPTVAAVDLAVERVNAGGGVLGRDVRLIVADEGSTAATAANSIQTLISRGADAIVGPASSLITLSVLDDILDAGKVTCSPTASALALDAFPDDDGLFFRTIPSDSLQAAAIAGAADQTGAQRVTIVYVDDSYGRPFAQAVGGSLQSEAIDVLDQIPFAASDDDLSSEAREVARSDTQVLIVLADGDNGTRFLEALDDVDTSGLSAIVVNDAFRNPAAPQRIQALGAELRSKIVGLAPHADSGDPDNPYDPPGLYAVNAYDCVNLIALAAVRAGSDAPSEIAAQLAQVSVSGQVCDTFAECATTIESDRQIDYNGPSGVTDLQPRTGDPSQAIFDWFVFTESGRDVLDRTEIVGR